MLRRVLRWLGIGVALLLILALGFLAYAYVASSRIIARTYDVPLTSFAVAPDSVDQADGARLASLWGCLAGCHGEDGGGTAMFAEPLIGAIKAPNITTILPEYSDAELERLIRRGVKRDGKSVFVMPTRFLFHLDDARLGAIIAHVRSLPKRDEFEGGVTFGPLGRVFVALGEFRPSAAEVDPESPRRAYPDQTDEAGLGEFWATTVCVECHGENLRGEVDFSPSLEVVATSYSLADFELLMRTGTAIGGRNVGLMSEIARDNTRHFTRSEVAGLYAYLNDHFDGGGSSE